MTHVPEDRVISRRIDVPEHLHRNSKTVSVDGYEETGASLIDLATRRLGLTTLADKDVLDVGCGVRFTQVIINREIPIKSYTGIEVYKPIVDYMQAEVEPIDPRFRFVHWDVQHGMYNDQSPRRLDGERVLPVSHDFDVMWFFSVFTHLDLPDARAMLTLARKAIRPGGGLYFTAFIQADLDRIEYRGSLHQLHMVWYGRRMMENLIHETGWELREFHPAGDRPFIQPCFVCSART